VRAERCHDPRNRGRNSSSQPRNCTRASTRHALHTQERDNAARRRARGPSGATPPARRPRGGHGVARGRRRGRGGGTCASPGVPLRGGDAALRHLQARLAQPPILHCGCALFCAKYARVAFGCAAGCVHGWFGKQQGCGTDDTPGSTHETRQALPSMPYQADAQSSLVHRVKPAMQTLLRRPAPGATVPPACTAHVPGSHCSRAACPLPSASPHSPTHAAVASCSSGLYGHARTLRSGGTRRLATAAAPGPASSTPRLQTVLDG
jgi:hypothetical protein